MDSKYIMLHQNVLCCEAGDDLGHCHYCFYYSLVITIPLSVCKRMSVCLWVCCTGWLGEWRELFLFILFLSWARENVRRRPSSFSLEGMFYFVNSLPRLSFLPPLTFLSVFFLFPCPFFLSPSSYCFCSEWFPLAVLHFFPSHSALLPSCFFSVFILSVCFYWLFCFLPLSVSLGYYISTSLTRVLFVFLFWQFFLRSIFFLISFIFL